MTITYFANPVKAATPAFEAGELGMIITPKQGNKLPDGVSWIADNGNGPKQDGSKGTGYPGDEGYLRYLIGLRNQLAHNQFATAPDVLGDAAATLKRSAPMLPKIRALGYKAALVAQDGLEALEVPWDSFDVLFLGGSTEWKLGPEARNLVAEAKAHGKQVHMGRVNSFKRLSYADEIGVDTADGTYLIFGPDKNLPKLLGWLDKLSGLTPTVRAYIAQGYAETQAKFLANLEVAA